MAENYQVRIAKAEHVFSAAHFITFGGQCERLHGHNYRVAAEVRGALDENYLVINFLLVREKLREIVLWLDHYMLLPQSHPEIQVVDDGQEVTARYHDRRWVFPSGDCRVLPMPNTTSEMLARFIGGKLREMLEEAGCRPEWLEVSVDECDGQIGVWSGDFDQAGWMV